ncbi:MAG TPA: hypothetical protein VNW90_03245 [Acetobacteraceae bacterium]|jgi:hypothetical protein|nr:hypothetical protein [Acetobacteraceae bacterium]
MSSLPCWSVGSSIQRPSHVLGLDPRIAAARALSPATAASSLGAVLGLGEVDEDEL